MELLLARVALAGIFAVAGTAKLLERRRIGAAVAEFGVPAGFATPLGWLLALGELGVAVTLVFPDTAQAGAVGVLGLLSIFSAVIVSNLVRSGSGVHGVS